MKPTLINEIRDVLTNNDLLIVYTWDADNLMAASMISGYVMNTGPGRLGYLAHEDFKPGVSFIGEIAEISRQYDSVVLLGPGWQGPEIDLLAANIHGEVVVIDNSWNYIQPRMKNVLYFNPSPRGDPRGNWPTVSFLVHMITRSEYYLEVAASVMAMMGQGAISSRVYQNMMVKAGLHHILDKSIPLECSNKLWGITVSQNPATFKDVPRSLVESGYDICMALMKDPLVSSYEVLASEIVNEVLKSRRKEYDSVKLVESDLPRNYSALLLTSRILLGSSVKKAITASKIPSGYRFCAWSLGKHPIASIVGDLRRRNAKVKGVYQGQINYVCGEDLSKSILKRVLS